MTNSKYLEKLHGLLDVYEHLSGERLIDVYEHLSGEPGTTIARIKQLIEDSDDMDDPEVCHAAR